MKKIDIITIFPATIDAYVNESILGRAQQNKLVTIQAHNLRTFSKDKHRRVDDTPYGGGPGMIMTVQPIADTIKKIKNRKLKVKSRVILTSASGKTFTQQDAKRLLKYEQLIFICGRYEGVDQRVEEYIADEALSIGNYVLTGGELPAMVITDAVVRLVPGVLGDKASLNEESHSTPGELEYPQYTKPEVYEIKNRKLTPPFAKGGVKVKNKKLFVPKVLLSGNHTLIKDWRTEQSKKRSQA